LIPAELRDLWKNPIILVSGFSALLMVGAVRLTNSYTARPLVVVSAGAVVYMIALIVLGGKMLMRQFGEAR
jgi:hypothetical protein